MLRLAADEHEVAPIAAFEEPEEALEPLRQAQIASMIADVADQGGQVFVVTHSVDIARSFAVEDIHLVADDPRGTILSLRDTLSAPAKQAYERRLDGTVVLGLFARLPVLVEGPGDRACSRSSGTRWPRTRRWPAPRPCDGLHQLRGRAQQPGMARVLCEAGKQVVAWVEGDVPDQLAQLRSNGHCAALVIYPADTTRHNLEALLSASCELHALGAAMRLIAEVRGYDWDSQRDDLLVPAGGRQPGAARGGQERQRRRRAPRVPARADRAAWCAER